MKKFLEHNFKGLAYYFIDRNYRTFTRLLLRLGSRKHYKSIQMKVQGMRLFIPDGPSFLWQFYEIFFKKIYQFNTDSDRPVILDGGANIGTSCLYFLKQHPKAIIHAFEPDPNIFKVLKQNLLENGGKQIELHEAALWKADGHLEFGFEGSDRGSIYMDSNRSKVKALRLRRIINEFEKVDFLKLDIEGAETEVILDCDGVLEKVDHLFIEFHSFNGQPIELAKILDVVSKAGFRYYIENAMVRKVPFLQKEGKYGMDNQINVSCYRV